jgi:hypothetical protein
VQHARVHDADTLCLRARRLLTACCLSDVLRIYAPDTPFSRERLKVRLA